LRNEQVFLPAMVHFTIHKDDLYTFEKEQAALEPLIKVLLRSYEGIFDQPVSISEKMISGLLKKEPAQVKIQLEQLMQSGVIDYRPQKDTPQLFFPRNRIRVEEISIDMVAYAKRKEQFRSRMKQMMKYVTENRECRSRMIGMYFGDSSIPYCGICDNCLRQKSMPVSKEEFESIRQQIMSLLKKEPLHSKDLLVKLAGIKKEKAWKVLEFLQAENKIEMDAGGLVTSLA